jgi:hypothetical protein
MSMRRPSAIAQGRDCVPAWGIEDLPHPLTVVEAVAQLDQLAARAGRSAPIDDRAGATIFRPSSADGSAVHGGR